LSIPARPFRADHVGSLLRPQSLKEAREKARRGSIGPDELRAAEDDAIRDVVALQEAAGLSAVTDGELRRTMWHTDFLTGLDGIEATRADYAINFKGEGGETKATASMMEVTGKVRRSRALMVDHFKFLKSVTGRTAKFCMPSPTFLHMRGGRSIVSEEAYPDMDEFWADIVRAFREEIRDLVEAGCTYLQIDDVSFATLCDTDVRQQIRRDGEDPERLAMLYSSIVDDIVTDLDKTLSVTMHTCRGNFQSLWMASGGYEAVADIMLNRIGVDGFFLEFDTDRAGGFEPLRFAPRNKKIVLGLVSSKVPRLETRDELKRRIDEASKYVPLENLCLSPQCGFASSHHGNRVDEDIVKRKLELVVSVATDIWGTAQ
jgi:5-methyltetrahydropteroyltriglutamate--homocysteine methyltransferase